MFLDKKQEMTQNYYRNIKTNIYVVFKSSNQNEWNEEIRKLLFSW